MFCREITPAATQYKRRVMTAMWIYFGTLYGSSYVLGHFALGAASTIALSVLPALPVLAVIAIIGLYLREETDEFQRDLTMQTLLWGMGGTLSVTTTLSFVERYLHTQHFSLFLVLVLFWGFTGIARMVYWLRFRAPREEEQVSH